MTLDVPALLRDAADAAREAGSAVAGRRLDWAMIERWATAWDVEVRIVAVRASLGL